MDHPRRRSRGAGSAACPRNRQLHIGTSNTTEPSAVQQAHYGYWAHRRIPLLPGPYFYYGPRHRYWVITATGGDCRQAGPRTSPSVVVEHPALVPSGATSPAVIRIERVRKQPSPFISHSRNRIDPCLLNVRDRGSVQTEQGPKMRPWPVSQRQQRWQSRCRICPDDNDAKEQCDEDEPSRMQGSRFARRLQDRELPNPAQAS